MAYSKQYTPEQAMQKARHYCAYQERCHQEVTEKLYALGLRKNEVENSLAQLIEEDYLNEERFAIQFAGGRFRMKGWGRIRIGIVLKQKRLSDYCIRRGLAAIDEADYLQSLERLARKRWEQLEGEPFLQRRKKTLDYLSYKGYENNLLQMVLAEIISGEGASPSGEDSELSGESGE